MINKLLYIGAGLDICTARQFSETHEFIFIDTLPRTEYGDIFKFSFSRYRHSFINELIKKASAFGFTFKKSIELNPQFYKRILNIKQQIQYIFNPIQTVINPILLLFYNNKTQQSIRYYVSTNILFNMCQNLRDDVDSCDAIYLKGYIPDAIILNYINKPIIFIGASYTTVFTIDDDDDDKNNLIYYLNGIKNNSSKLKQYFKKFYIYNETNTSLQECSNFNEFMSISYTIINKVVLNNMMRDDN